MRIKVFIILFLFVSAFLIISNGNLHLKNTDEAMEFANQYYAWILGLAGNTFRSTAYVVGFNWLPESIDNINNLSLNNTNLSTINLSK